MCQGFAPDLEAAFFAGALAAGLRAAAGFAVFAVAAAFAAGLRAVAGFEAAFAAAAGFEAVRLAAGFAAAALAAALAVVFFAEALGAEALVPAGLAPLAAPLRAVAAFVVLPFAGVVAFAKLSSLVRDRRTGRGSILLISREKPVRRSRDAIYCM